MLSMLKNVADFVTPVLTESNFAEVCFCCTRLTRTLSMYCITDCLLTYTCVCASARLQKGVLTPEEFVIAGDQLVFSCRTWAWSGGNKGTQKKYLPDDKQFLITRNVPSLRRAHTYALAGKEEVLRGLGSAEMDDAEGWLSTHSQADMASSRQVHDMEDEGIAGQMQRTHIAQTGAAAASSAAPSAGKPAAAAASSADDEIGDIDDEMDATANNNTIVPRPAAAAATSSDGAADEFPDMEAFEEDDNVLAPPAPAAAAAKAASNQPKQSYLKAEEPEDNIVKTYVGSPWRSVSYVQDRAINCVASD
jgi:hypothetical protein